MEDEREGLAPFIAAQDRVLAAVEAELARGRKLSHWMWFVFPQLRGLGRSDRARFYGLTGRAEAVAYAVHPVLGPRLARHTGLVCGWSEKTAHEIFGSPDDFKFRSSMTLFAEAATDPAPFLQALEMFFDGEPDPATLRLLS